MSIKTKSSGSWFTVLLVISALAIWAYDHKEAYLAQDAKSSGQPSAERPKTKPSSSKETPRPRKSGPNPPASTTSPQVEKMGGFEIYQNCVLMNVRGNDGDSFFIRLHDGREVQIRLYFVDTPESEFRTYADGDTNFDRIREQAEDLDHITSEQAVEIGKKGKDASLEILSKRPFTLYTRWDSPFVDGRFHAHIQVKIDGKTRWLHRVLIQRGLARIKTKGADLPDGTSADSEKQTLRDLEREAKRNKAGAWAL